MHRNTCRLSIAALLVFVATSSWAIETVDGTLIARAEGNSILILDGTAEAQLQKLTIDGEVFGESHDTMCFSPDDSLLAAATSAVNNGYYEFRLVAWNTQTGVRQYTEVLTDCVREFRFSGDGKRLAVASDDWVALYDTGHWKVLNRADRPERAEPIVRGDVQFIRNSEVLATAFEYDAGQHPPSNDIITQLRFLEIATGKEVWSARFRKGELAQIACSPDGRAYALCFLHQMFDLPVSNITVVIVNARKGTSLRGLDIPLDAWQYDLTPDELKFSEDGRTLTLEASAPNVPNLRKEWDVSWLKDRLK